MITIADMLYHNGPMALQANFTRASSVHVAALASLGWITSLDAQGVPTKHWRLTSLGLRTMLTHYGWKLDEPA